MITNEDVRSGQCAAEHNQPGAIKYKVVFDGKNVHFYRHVEKGIGYRGNTYPESGWVLAWSDNGEYAPYNPPQFVSDRV